MKSWLDTALEPSVRNRALRVALVVGTLLVLINHLDTLLDGDVTGSTLAKALLTYAVPYAVSTHASVAALRAARRERPSDPG